MHSDFIPYERVVREHPAIQHPFVENFGRLSVEGLRSFVREQYRLSTTFSQALAATYALAEDVQTDTGLIPAWEFARPLAEMVHTEHWGSSSVGAHWKEFMRLAESLGLTRDELTNAQPIPETMAFVETRAQLCLAGPFPRAAGALGFTELANETIFARYLVGAQMIASRTDTTIDLGYFQAHVRDELGDYALFQQMLTPHLRSPDHAKAEEEIGTGMRKLLDVRKQWYDALEAKLLQ